MQLTEHFTLSEFVRSETAERNHINNTPSQEVVDNLRALCRNVLEPARVAFGEPIYITSGYRCPALNKAVGGKITSQHLRGEAADLQVRWCEEPAQVVQRYQRPRRVRPTAVREQQGRCEMDTRILHFLRQSETGDR